jgi:hypothetical protein
MSEATNKAKTVTLWIVVGAAALVSFAGILSFGLFTMPLAMAGAIVLAARLDSMRGWAIMLCAIAVAPLFMAWFNRAGPGLICRNDPPYGVGCSDQLNPWPLVAGAAVTLVVAAVLFVHASRRDAAKPGHDTPSA